MTNTAKVWTVIVVIIILGIVGWLILGGNSPAQMPNPTPTPEQATTTTTTGQNQPSSGLTTADNDVSDAALEKDLLTVDGELNGLGSDSNAVGESVANHNTPLE